ncbi:MAG: NAD(+) diphosphatase [Wenzhouxiangella sp.]|nr:MAG: NAD(+) diphosphatase [Wenzhouxiangella sp.]
MKQTPAREPILKYGGAGINRAADLREDPRWIEQALKRPETRFMAVWNSRSLLSLSRPDQPQAVRLSLPQVGELEEAVFLGLEDSAAVFAVDWSDREAPEHALEDGTSFVDLRRFGPLLGGKDANLLAYARAMVNWHRTHRYCGRCGSPTTSINSGHRRRCSNADCGQISFPRTDPAIIVLVEHAGDDGGPPRCLLGRSPHFPPGMYSTLAGFVEPGESLEQTVRREVFEESGIELSSVRYLASQPWPFPGSLMLGFHATASSTHIRRNDDELEDVRWFDLAELEQFGESGEGVGYCLPRHDSIARFLMESWRESVSPDR